MKKITAAILTALPVLIISAGLLLAVRSLGGQVRLVADKAQPQWTDLVDGTPQTTQAQFVAFGSSAFPSSGWAIQADGSLHGQNGASDLISKANYANFEIELEWKVAPGGNSGIFYRIQPMAGKPIYENAFECQVYGPADLNKVNAVYRPGALYNLYGNDSVSLASPVGQWNTVRIVVNGNHVQHYLNDVKVVDAQLGSADYLARLKRSKFAKVPGYGLQTCGPIGLQSDGGEVWYRNMKIRKL